MINSADIYNYQSHADTHIEFSPGVNALVGKSNDGKSATLRALLWVITNRPLGNSFVRHGQDDCSVSIHATSGVEVTRSKGKDGNTYTLKVGGSADPATFTAFGSDPPPQVVEALNINDTNTQRQFQPYFLVFDPPGQVAEYIRRVTKLDEIDSVIDLIQKDHRATKNDIESTSTEIGMVESKLVELSAINLDELKSLINDYKRLQTEIKTGKSFIEDMESLLLTLIKLDISAIWLPTDADETLQKSITARNANKEASSDFDGLMDLITNIANLEDCAVTIPDLGGMFEERSVLTSTRVELLSDADTIGGILDQLKKSTTIPEFDAGIADRSVSAIDKYNRAVKEINDLGNLLIEISKIDSFMRVVGVDINRIIEEKAVLANQLTECPTCGSELSITSKEVLLRNV